MARRDQVRYQLYLPKDVSTRLEALAAEPGDRFAAFVERVGRTLASGSRILEPEESDDRG